VKAHTLIVLILELLVHIFKLLLPPLRKLLLLLLAALEPRHSIVDVDVCVTKCGTFEGCIALAPVFDPAS
jgi:hypothetical protein